MMNRRTQRRKERDDDWGREDQGETKVEKSRQECRVLVDGQRDRRFVGRRSRLSHDEQVGG